MIPREELLEALREFADEIGETPTRTQMNESGPYSSMPYYREFGSWNAALEAAGLDVNHENSISDERLVEEMLRVEEEVGRLPRFEDMEEHGEFSGHTYLRRWGSWSAAKEAAGLTSDRRTSRRLSRECLVEAIDELTVELGRPPTQQEMNEVGAYSHRAFYREWGSWAAALEAAGYEPNHQNGYDEATLTEAMQALASELGYPPTMDQMRNEGRISAQPYRTRYETWIDAWEAAGLDLREGNLASRLSRETLLDEMKRLSNELGHAPTRDEMDVEGKYSHTPYVYRFGSWSEALEAAGFTPYRQVGETHGPIKYGPNWSTQRQKALTRDGHECQRCGVSEENQRENGDGGLHVHHIKKRRLFADATEANKLSNLISLCRQCHSHRERHPSESG
ncbi:homing endonuclease associated repeat-containing protein [Halobium palmae]|uniref:Homing endonuclease associated repeat-containing protein n=1 Tax=Halobium palmae TaxID=1776492 RepID=A0ABD5RUV4_9EURY